MTEKKAVLFVNKKKKEALELAQKITARLEKRGWTGILDENPEAGVYRIAFSLGGDGTVLYTARIMAPLGIPVLPLNLGTLGFIAAVHPADWEEVFARWENGTALLSSRLMLDISVERDGVLLEKTSCLNDLVVSASGIAKLIRLDVEAEGRDKIKLGQFRADGLIIASPTGSTAYSVAAGGPIVDPEMDLFIINPVCPFTLSNRPIAVPADESVSVLVESEQRSDVLLTVDGQITRSLLPGDRIIVRRSPFRALLVASDRGAFYRALRTKLAWSGGVEGHDA